MRKLVSAIVATLLLVSAGCSNTSIELVEDSEASTSMLSKRTATFTTFDDDFYSTYKDDDYGPPEYEDSNHSFLEKNEPDQNIGRKSYAVGEEIQVEKLRVRINGISYVDAYNDFVAGAGKKFVLVSVDAYTDSIPENAEYYSATDAVNQIRLTNGQYIGQPFMVGEEAEISPGKWKTVNIVFTVSKDKSVDAVVLRYGGEVLIDSSSVKSEKPEEVKTTTENTTTTAKETTTTINQTQKTKYEIGEYFNFDGLEIVLDYGIQFKTIQNQFSEYDGKTVIAIPASVKNISGKTHGLNIFQYNQFGPDGTQLPTSISAYFTLGIDDIGDLQNGAIDYGYMYMLYEGDGDYLVVFDNYNEQIEVSIPVKKQI